MITATFLALILFGGELLLLAGIIFLYLQFRRFQNTKRAFFEHASHEDVEKKFFSQIGRIEKTERDIASHAAAIAHLERIADIAVTRVGLVRFNPFANTGGTYSFALALLNHAYDGVIISTLHSREGSRFFAKTIRAGKPEQRLSAEEEQALEQAVTNEEQALMTHHDSPNSPT